MVSNDNDNPLSGLTDDQAAQVMQVQELTGEDDLAACRLNLEQCEWNIQLAVNRSLFDRENVSDDVADDAEWQHQVHHHDPTATSTARTGSNQDTILQHRSSRNANAAAASSSSRPLPVDSHTLLPSAIRTQLESASILPPTSSVSSDRTPTYRLNEADEQEFRDAIMRQINRLDRHHELAAGSGGALLLNHNHQQAAEFPPRFPIPRRNNNAATGAGGGNFFWQWVTGVFDYFYQWTFVVLTTVWRFFQTLALPGMAGGGAGPNNYLLGSRAAQGRPDASPAAVLAEVEEFIRDIEQKYGGNGDGSDETTTHPTFYRGSFNQASRECIAQAKFLLVYLHAPNAPLTDRFCREVLFNNTALRDIINNANNMLLWGSSISTPPNGEGYRTMRKLRTVNSFPSLCFLTPVSQSMRLSAVIDGPTVMNVPQLIDKIYECVAANAANLEELSAERRTHATNRAIRAEQDQQFQESLRADQEKEREKQRQVVELERQLSKKTQRREARVARKKALEERKREALTKLPAEPTTAAGEQIRINLKLPSGQRVERRFVPTDDVQCVYYFALAQNETTDKFKVLSNFPRRALACSPSDPHISLKDANLKKAEALFVEMEEDDSTGSDDDDIGDDDDDNESVTEIKKPISGETVKSK